MDIWGVGCIIAELLQKTPSHSQDHNAIKNEPLFPGKSCFPLSPDKHAKKSPLKKYPVSEKDQLNVVMEVLGTPTDDDLSFITDSSAVTYLKDYPQGHVGINWKERFPYASPIAIDCI